MHALGSSRIAHAALKQHQCIRRKLQQPPRPHLPKPVKVSSMGVTATMGREFWYKDRRHFVGRRVIKSFPFVCECVGCVVYPCMCKSAVVVSSV